MVDSCGTLDCTQLWSEIGEFDKEELDNSVDMKPTNWEARESARMEAYNKLFDRFLDQNRSERRFHCLITNQYFTWEEFVKHKEVCNH